MTNEVKQENMELHMPPERKFTMKNRIALGSVLTFVFFCEASVMRAQAPPKALASAAPVLPMDITFRYVPQYFQQSFKDDSRYARIEALVGEGRCDVILLDKTTNRETFYSTLNRKVDALAATGADAYTTRIDFAASSTIDSYFLFLIHFHDRFGQEVTWQFVAGEMVRHASPEVISRIDSFGITLLYVPRRAPGVPGTTLTIAGRKYVPASAQSDDALATFYATDMTVGQIFTGTDLWHVETSPGNGEETATWILTGDGRRQRMLAVKQLSDTEAVVDQIELNDPDAPLVVLDLVRTNDTFGVQSLSFETPQNTLWFFFGPALPLPAHQADDQTSVTFTVAENEQASIASGELQVQRAVDAEHLLWRFDTPDLARGASLETGVNLTLGGSEQANCANEDCSVRSRKQE
jgi:hypothetical protein